MSLGQNLLDGPPPTLLPPDPAAGELGAGVSADEAVRNNPTSSLAWAVLSDEAWAEGRVVESYAFARVGYHRGLDSLRRAGWRGQGPLPWAHEPNRGFLRALAALARAARVIGETEEEARCGTFLRDCSRAAADALGF